MQTTLLGLAIAFILALVAALVGPFFIDWSQFRPQFEAEASRIVGAPVRVSGALDARLLPAPSLQLHGVRVGGANDLGRIGADKLNVEFSLGSLMRGEWRATELTVNGAAVDLGLNAQGRLDLPASTGPFNLGGLAIDRVNITGRATLHDAASQSSIELRDIAFSGDVRSLAAGAMRGDGNFVLAGARYPFRVSSGQSSDGTGTRLRLTVEAGDNPLGIDLEGILKFDNRAPSFDGAMTLLHAGKVDDGKADGGTAPWRIVGKVKADASQAVFDSVEVSYGTEDALLKLAGLADVRFGATPLLHAVLSAKQLDADRVLAKQGGDAAMPVAALRRLLGGIPQPPLPTQLEASAEQIMLGGRPLQNVSAELHGDHSAWTVERLELRAPGSTRVVASGAADGASGFSGAISIDSADPDVLSGWLKGRSSAAMGNQKPLRIRGDFTSRADRLAIDDLRADIDGGTLQGRIALASAGASGGSRLDADLKADRLDIDAATGLLRSFGGSPSEWPDAGKLSLDIDRALSAGQEMRSLALQIAYDPRSVSLERLKLGDRAGVTLDASGAFDRVEATGRLSLQANAFSLAKVGDVVAPVVPALAARLAKLPTATGPVRINLGLDVAKTPQKPDRGTARLALDIDAPQIKGKASMVAAPAVTALRNLDLDALSRSELSLESALSGQGRAVLALVGLEGLFAAGDAPLALDARASGAWKAPMQVTAKLAGAELDADMQGTAEPWAASPKAALTLAVRNANVAPTLGLKPDDVLAKTSLSSRVVLDGDKVTLEDIDGTLAGSRLRGKLVVTRGPETSLDGQLGADTIDLGPAFGLMIGARGEDGSEPLGRGLLQGWRGQVALQALGARLPGGTELRPLSAVIRNDGHAFSFQNIKGKIGNGDLTGDLDLKPAGAIGYALGARIELSGADGPALRYRSLALPAGKASVKLSLASQGRSAAALEGAISGNGLVSLDGLRVAGLDPRAFDVAIRATDAGQAVDDARLRQIVEPALAAGELAVGSAQIPFSIKDSRLRVGATTLDAQGARAIVSGGYDIVADQVDIRATLAGAAAGAVRPEIQLFIVGSPDHLDRTVDVASLSSWLAVRAIDRETRRLDALERGETPSASEVPTMSAPTSPDVPLPGRNPRRGPPKAASRPVVPPVSQQIAPLPTPIEVRPAPGAARSPTTQPSQPLRPRPAPPLMLLPPAAVPSARPAP